MHRLKRLEAIICDWSGVVSDDRKLAHGANSMVLEHHGLKPMPFDEWLRDMEWADPVGFFASRGLHLDAATAYSFYAPFCEVVRKNGGKPVVYETAQRFLPKVAPRRVAIVSKHPPAAIETEAQEYGIREHIHALHGAVADKAVSILAALDAFGIEPRRAAYIGDMPQDIEAARKAGVLAIAVTYGYQTRERLERECPDILVDSLDELHPYL